VIYIFDVVQAPRLGKICGQRTGAFKVLEKSQNFGKVEYFQENTKNCYSKQCFGGLGVPAGSWLVHA